MNWFFDLTFRSINKQSIIEPAIRFLKHSKDVLSTNSVDPSYNHPSFYNLRDFLAVQQMGSAFLLFAVGHRVCFQATEGVDITLLKCAKGNIYNSLKNNQGRNETPSMYEWKDKQCRFIITVNLCCVKLIQKELPPTAITRLINF